MKLIELLTVVVIIAILASLLAGRDTFLGVPLTFAESVTLSVTAFIESLSLIIK
jgi:hypothetical protein